MSQECKDSITAVQDKFNAQMSEFSDKIQEKELVVVQRQSGKVEDYENDLRALRLELQKLDLQRSSALIAHEEQLKSQDIKKLEHERTLAAMEAESRPEFVAAREKKIMGDIQLLEAQTKAHKALKSTEDVTAVTEKKLELATHTEELKLKQADMDKKIKLGLGLGTLSVAAVMAAYFGFRHYYTPRPTIIEKDDTSLIGLIDRMRGYKVPVSRLDDVVLEDELRNQVIEKFMGLINAVKNQLPLSNMMFYGPAGTGKTMAATAFLRRMSEQKLAHHVIVRGPAFKRLGSPHAAQNALASVLRWALRESKWPVIFLFDEAETMFADRDSIYANEMTNDLVTTLLSFFERGINNRIMFILSTNYPNRIDRALLNRIDPSNRIRFNAPGHEQRAEMLKSYLNQHIIGNKFTIDKSIYAALPQLATDMDGLVGRQIDSLVAQTLYPMLNNNVKELSLDNLHMAIENAKRKENMAAY